MVQLTSQWGELDGGSMSYHVVARKGGTHASDLTSFHRPTSQKPQCFPGAPQAGAQAFDPWGHSRATPQHSDPLCLCTTIEEPKSRWGGSAFDHTCILVGGRLAQGSGPLAGAWSVCRLPGVWG